jgi:hypothetical protein
MRPLMEETTSRAGRGQAHPLQAKRLTGSVRTIAPGVLFSQFLHFADDELAKNRNAVRVSQFLGIDEVDV